MIGRVLGIDPGDKNIGISISDPTGTIANPLCMLAHKSREVDAAAIVQIASESLVVRIVIGLALDSEGEIGPQGRKAMRLAESIRVKTEIPVFVWDETGSTNMAKEAYVRMRVKKDKRKGHLDVVAAQIILQSYLDSNPIGMDESARTP